jgi:ribonucleoside-diphosphate reductase alpha chain
MSSGEPSVGAPNHSEPSLSANARRMLADRYLLRDLDGTIMETPGQMMDRVAGFVAQAEDLYRPGSSGRWSEAFGDKLRRLEFLPNSPTLMNAGTELGLLAACVVLPLDDSLRSIFGTLRDAALVQQAGAGVGFSFSRLRPAGDVVASTRGVASGPVSFMRLFDLTASVIRQGGRRRGASMAVLDVSHPDIEAFLSAKDDPAELTGFNLSVAVPDAFLAAVVRGEPYALVNPRTGATVRRADARAVFDRLCEAAWRSGEPGLLFIDEINRTNPLPDVIEATNPCGEVPLLPYESCNLGSIDLSRHVIADRVDWQAISDTVAVAVRFLDDVIDVNRYPTSRLASAARGSRKIGLGVMGFADLLVRIGIPYDTKEAVEVAERVADHIQREAHRASTMLAGERGVFPRHPASTLARSGQQRRNAQVTSIAPTGSLSILAEATSGIEPMFAVAYERSIAQGRVREVNRHFREVAERLGFWSAELERDITHTGRVRGDPRVPAEIQRTFVTALEIPPEQHVGIQAAFQRHVDAAVSKTINLPEDATVSDVRHAFLGAWRSRLKGITVYRYGSRPDQVLTLTDGGSPVCVAPDFAGGCVVTAPCDV